MTQNPRRSSSPHHPFLFSFLLLALLMSGVVGLSARTRLEASRDSAAPATKTPAILSAVPVKDGRDFAGFYQELSATDLGESLYVSLKFQIFNYSDALVNGATIRMSDHLTNQSMWSFAGVSIEDRRSIVVSGEFTVAQSEYENWQKGGTPNLTVEFQNAQGEKIQRTVELIRMFIGEVQ